jgi:hypothetical protein
MSTARTREPRHVAGLEWWSWPTATCAMRDARHAFVSFNTNDMRWSSNRNVRQPALPARQAKKASGLRARCGGRCRSQESRISRRSLDCSACRARRMRARSIRNSATASRAYSRLVPGGNSKTSPVSKGLAKRTVNGLLADAEKATGGTGLSTCALIAVWVRPGKVEHSRLATPGTSAASTTLRARALPPVRHRSRCGVRANRSGIVAAVSGK